MITCFSEANTNPLWLLATYSIGLCFDIVTCFFLLIPYTIYLTLVPDKYVHSKTARFSGYVCYFISLFLLIFISFSEYFFWNEFQNRFNFIAVDYLIYTNEVIGNIRESYPLFTLIFFVFLVTVALFIAILKWFPKNKEESTRFTQRLSQGLIYLAIPIFAIFFLKNSMAEFSPNHYNGELAKNGIFSLVTAFFENTLDFEHFYQLRDQSTALKHIRKILKTDNAQFVENSNFPDITRNIHYDGSEKKKNVIIIVIESLSAQFFEKSEGKGDITPCLNSLIQESLSFTNTYASGTRTDRGLEAIMVSVPPTPGRSIIKRPQNTISNFGNVFREKGYETKFIYAGFGYFDNMNNFFSNNGFATVDRTDFHSDEITFSNIWGVCDENLYDKVLSESDKSFQSGKPFFSVVLTTSNHRPYTYPEGKIDIPSGIGRSGAVKYADYSVGQFITKAKSKAWFSNTVFVIVADHCANSAGKVKLPVNKYRIPLIFYSPGFISTKTIHTICSQIDVCPTLLGLLNISYKSDFYGKDVLNFPAERALLGTYQKLGLLSKDILTVLEPGKKAFAYKIMPDQKQISVELSEELLLETISYYQTASYWIKYNNKD